MAQLLLDGSCSVLCVRKGLETILFDFIKALVIFVYMRITLIQSDIIWGDPQANRLAVDRLIASENQHARTDMYILPEMFSTGFATSEEDLIEDEPSASLEWMKTKAAELDAAICGSIALRLQDGRRVNRLYFVRPDGSADFYDKRHLFGYGGETRRFSAGKERVIVEYKGLRFLLAVCYDLRFPVWLRNRADYDAIIIVASWPESRRFAWDTLLKARAIENQCYVLAVNRTGKDPNCIYNGGSCLISPTGEELAMAEDGRECQVCAEMDIDSLEHYRRSFPVLEDSDQHTIIL